MAKTTRETGYPELDNIREDLESLKTNVVELTRHVQENGYEKTVELSNMALKQIADLKKRGQREYTKVERSIKAKPGQSLAIAFAVGIAASYLLGRR